MTYQPTNGLVLTNGGPVPRSLSVKLGDDRTVKDFGASGSALTTTGAISSGGNVLTVANAFDFSVGQGIRIIGAGAPCAVSTPTAATGSAVGTTGSTTYTYKIASIGVSGAISAATATVTIANGNATLSATNYNSLSWSAPAGTAPAGYVVYGNNSGSLVPVAIVGTTSWNDYGTISFNGVTSQVDPPAWMPTSPPASPQASYLVSTISAVSGNSITLNSAASSNVSNATVMHDDTAALSAAFTYATANYGVVRIPAGVYWITGALPIITNPISIIGEGSRASQINVDPSFQGDVISATGLSYYENYDYTYTTPIRPVKAALYIEGVCLLGNRAGPYVQNGIMLYDTCDFIRFNDVQVHFLRGTGFGSGYLLNTVYASLRESSFIHLYVRNCGDIEFSRPAMEIYSDGVGDTTNEVTFLWCQIGFPWGKGLVIRNANASLAMRNIWFYSLMVHGIQSHPSAINADLVTIGDPALTGILTNSGFVNFTGSASYSGHYCVRFTAPSYTNVTDSVYFQGIIGSGANGFHVEYGRNLTFKMQAVLVDGTHFKIGPTPNVGALNFELNGKEQNYTWDIDSSATGQLRFPAVRIGSPTGQQAFTLNVPDATVAGGNARGIGSVDLQTVRAANFQVASGTGAVILGGSSNTCAGLFSVIMSGLNNFAVGAFTMLAGRSVSDKTRYGGIYYGLKEFSAQGDNQFGIVALSAQTIDATTTQMTADLDVVGTKNIVNLVDNQCYSFSATLVGRSSAGDVARYTLIGAIKRGSGAGTVAMVGTTTVTKTHGDAGTAGWGTPTATADTTNGGINISVTGAAATNINWGCRLDLVEVG